MTIEEQIIEMWRINNRINLYMIKHISDDAMKATLSKRGGRGIAGQFAHIHNVRVWRVRTFAKKLNVELKEFGKSENPDKKQLIISLQQSSSVMEQYLHYCIDKGGVVPNFKTGVVPMLGYMTTHEAHHRGAILLTMKQCGFKLSEELKWGIWFWNKI